MPLFNLTSIDFRTDTRTGGVADLIDKQYTASRYEIMKYPIDLGNYDKGHYMIFHINEQIRTNYAGPTINDLPIIKRNQRVSGLTATQVTVGSGSTVDQIISSSSFSLGEIVGQFERPIRRTSKTVALYMPDTVAFTFNQSYSTPSTSSGIAPALLAAGKSAADVVKESPNSAKGFLQSLSNSNMATFAGAGLLEGLKKLGLNEGFTQSLGQSVLGAVQNPMLEVIYSSPSLRSFRFDFMFYPRSEKEAQEVQNILHTFRFYQAPEILEKTAGFFLVPPSEFDILFFYNGKINPNIPPISTCVLESIDVDYAPNGWAAYETGDDVSSLSPKIGGTGTPVAIRMGLQFRETEIVTKQFIAATEPSDRKDTYSQRSDRDRTTE